MATLIKLKWRPAEMLLLGVALLVCIGLVALGLSRGAEPHFDADMATPEMSCQSLVQGLRALDERRISRLTTPHGHSLLQQYVRSGKFASYAKIADRIVGEWGRSIFWKGLATEGYNFGLTRTVKPREPSPRIELRRAPKGWQVDNYVPGPDRLIRQYAKFGPAWNLD